MSLQSCVSHDAALREVFCLNFPAEYEHTQNVQKGVCKKNGWETTWGPGFHARSCICPFLCLDLSFSNRISRILFLPQMQELHASMRDRKFYICHEDTDTIERWCWVRNPRETLNETSCSLSFFFKRKKVNQEKKRVMSFLHEAYQKQSKGKCLLLGVFLPKKREWSSRDSFRIIFFSWQDSSS